VVGGIFEQLYRLARARAGMFMLGRCPNYRSSENLQNCQPLTPAEKFRIASEHSLDRGTFILVESTQVKANGQTRTDLSAWEPLASGTRVTGRRGVAAVAISNAYTATTGPQAMPLPSSAFKSADTAGNIL
jgi:hypothetical protein